MVNYINLVVSVDSSFFQKVYNSEYYKDNNFSLESKTKSTCMVCLKKITKEIRYGLLGN